MMELVELLLVVLDEEVVVDDGAAQCLTCIVVVGVQCQPFHFKIMLERCPPSSCK